MDLSLRLMLVIGAVGTLVMICASIKKNRIQIEDSLFWVVFAAFLVFIAIFPQPVYWLARAIGFQAPSNFIFVAVTAILLIKEFRNSSKISVLKYRVNQLAEEIALDRNEEEHARDTEKDQR